MQTTFPILRETMKYELNVSERNGRYASLMMLSSSTDHQGLKLCVPLLVRKSDVMADFDHSIAVLMSETDQSSALCAVDRFCELLKSQFDPRFSVVTYPSDEDSVDHLIEKAQKRLYKASHGHCGYVVYED